MAEKLVKQGFRVGEWVRLKKRITIKHGATDDDRKDMSAGTVVAIKGFVGPHIVADFTFTPYSKKKDITVEWKLNPENLEIAMGPGVGDCVDGGKA